MSSHTYLKSSYLLKNVFFLICKIVPESESILSETGPEYGGEFSSIRGDSLLKNAWHYQVGKTFNPWIVITIFDVTTSQKNHTHLI